MSAHGPTVFRRVRTKHVLKTAMQTKQNVEFQRGRIMTERAYVSATGWSVWRGHRAAEYLLSGPRRRMKNTDVGVVISYVCVCILSLYQQQ